MLDEKLENGNLRELLLKKERIEPLEHLIEEYSKTLESLNKKGLDFGIVPKKEELQGILQESKDFVNKFLDIKADDPRIRYHSLFMKEHPYNIPLKKYGLAITLLAGGLVLPPLAPFLAILSLIPFFQGFYTDMELRAKTPCYDHILKMILLYKWPEASLKHTTAHEYTHHVQSFFCGKDMSLEEYIVDYKSFHEGHARGVERAAAYHFKEKYNNEAHIYEVTDTCLGEFKAAYKWMCRNSGKKPKDSLLKTRSSKDRAESRYDYHNFRPSPYAIGSSLLSIEEEKHGKDIYKKLLKGDASFL